MPTTHNDGNLAFGSQVVTIDSVAFDAEEVNISRTAEITTIPNSDKTPVKQAFVYKVMAGSMVLVFPNPSTAAPALAASLSLQPAGGGTPLLFYITAVNEIFRQEEQIKCAVEVTQILSVGGALPGPWADGDLGEATAVGPFRVTFQRPENSYIYRQQWVQHQNAWGATPWGDPCPYNPFAELVLETDPSEFGGGGLVTWEKVWATGPNDRDERMAVVKTYKKLLKQWTGSTLTAASVVSRTQTVNGTMQFRYSHNPATFNYPGVPDVAVNTVGNFTFVDPINGFPFNSTPGSGADENDYVHFISGSHQRWMGNFWEARLLYA